MTMGTFPNDPNCRKVIIVLQQHDIERCNYEPGEAKKLLDEELHVQPYPIVLHDNAPRAQLNIVESGMARPGAILIQSPYDHDAYEDAAGAAQRFALAKHMYFSTLCMMLGAKEVKVEQIDLHTKSGKTSITANGERLGTSASASVDHDSLEKLRAHMQLHDRFSGGAPDIEGAERLLRKTALINDPNLRTLLEMRRCTTNQLLNRKLVLSLSSEANSNLQVAGRLKVPAFVQVSAEFGRSCSEQQDYTLTVQIQF